jgi:polyisoprenyl-phosphate glycosyltransferase
MARWTFTKLLSSERPPPYNSYRFMLGEIGRSVAAYAGSGIYLDVAIGWVTQRFATHPIQLREEGDRTSGYSLRSLASHFWRLVLTSGTRPLRLMSLVGAAFASTGFVVAILVLIARLAGAIDEVGWASLTTVVLVGFGLVLFTLGLVAEYVGIAAQMAMGRPPFLIVGDTEQGPLGRTAPPDR